MVRPVRSNRVLCYQGDPSDVFYLVLQGKLHQVKHRSDGSELLVTAYGPGSWVGLIETLLDTPYLADITSAVDSSVLAFSKGTVVTLRKIPDVTDAWLDALARTGYRLHAAIGDNTPMAALCSYLLSRSVSLVGGTREGVYATQEQIAAELGFTRETVNKHLRQLEEEHLVRIGRGLVELLDREKLSFIFRR